MFEKKKTTTIVFITFFDNFVAKKGNDNCHCLFWFFGGFVVKKVTATMSSPSSMVVVF